MINTELIDKYFDGSMTAEEMEGFEQTLSTDPLLNNEFQFQKEIVDGIKLARKNELKSTLNAIDVSGIASSSTIWNAKTISAAAIITVGGVIAYMMIPNNNEIDNNNPQAIIENTAPVSIEISETESTPEVTEAPIIDKNVSKKETPNLNSSAKEEENINIEIIDDFGDYEDNEINHAIVPENFMNGKGSFDHATIEVITNSSKKKYSFHYQVKDNKLFLYGEFENIYEVLEFKNDTENDLFLYYGNKYYDINETENNIVPLTEMTVEETTELKQKIHNSNEAKSQ